MKNIFLNKCSFELSKKFFLIIFLIMTILSSFLAYFTGYYGGDLEGLKYAVSFNKLFSYTVLSVIFIFISYSLSKCVSSKNVKYFSVKVVGEKFFYITMLFVTISLLLVTVYGNVGTIHRDLESNRFAELIFAFFTPYYLILYFIYYMFNNQVRGFFKSSIFSIVFIVYLILIIRSGFTGYLFYVFPIFVFFFLKVFGFFFTWLFLTLSVLLLPVLRGFKYFLIIGFENFDLSVLDFEFFMIFSKTSIDRFSSVPNMIYIMENLKDNTDLLSSNYIPIFQGYIGSFFHKILFGEPVNHITLFLYQSMHESDLDSNSTFPLISYFDIDFFLGVFTLVFAFILFVLCVFLVKLAFSSFKIKNSSLESYFLFLLLFFSFFGGWFWNVWAFIQSLTIFLILIFLNNLCVFFLRNSVQYK